ncbi:MAG: T9SS type A sorting domain-containing protein [Candidatus Cloacimonetes bacterium]|nr:T9SS type A sorting domain-containing protein [Candidatus Cloacimonadota bacterium]
MPDVVNMVGNNNSLVPVNNNISDLIEDVIVNITYRHDTNLNVPFHVGYQRFEPPMRNKGFILFSDGLHNYTISPNNIQTYINNNYLPDIKCHSICYTTDYAFADMSMSNMSMIAQWGEGLFYHRPNVSYSYYDVQSLINGIRQTNSTTDTRGIIISNQATSIPFSVDSKTFRIKSYLSFGEEMLTDEITLNLTSPSGTEYNEYLFYGVMDRLDINNPETGRWTATIENNSELSVEYCFGVEVISDIQTEISEIPQFQPVDSLFLVSVSVTDYLEPVLDAEVTLTISRDTWSKEIILYDNGANGDLIGNDGVYSTYVYIYNEVIGLFSPIKGVYEFTYNINSQLQDLKRSIRRHIYMSDPVYPFVARNLRQGWNWVGFPKLVRENGGNLVDYAAVSLEPYLSIVLSDKGYASYEDYWSYYGLQYLDSKVGYKLRIRDIDNIKLFEMGTKVDTTSVYKISEGWNWITYPCYTTVYPEEALANILDDIDYIKAQKWSMKKKEEGWVHDNFSLRPIIKYGDSIEVRAINNTSLVWNGYRPRGEIKPLVAQFYTYEDKPNYETIMVESIEGNPTYEEIGIYQGDNCIGARVFEGYPLQILAYSEPANGDSTELEFRIWAGDKKEIVLKPASVYEDMVLSQENHLYPELNAFRHVHLKQNDENAPAVFALEGNYPNPFNPSTTVRFSIPNEGKVKLSIYNIRGQKVADLIDGELSAGIHQAIWQGKDNGGRSIASGIYFAKLQQGKRNTVHKMVLLK